MTKPRLVKVRALFYVFQQVIKKRLRLFLTQPRVFIAVYLVLVVAAGGWHPSAMAAGEVLVAIVHEAFL